MPGKLMGKAMSPLICLLLYALIVLRFCLVSFPVGRLEAGLWILLPSCLLYPYHLDFKITFWLKFIQCYLDHNSPLYRFLSKGKVLRLMAVITSVTASFIIFYFFYSLKMDWKAFAVMALASLALSFLTGSKKQAYVPFLAEDLKERFARYLPPFYLALLCAAVMVFLHVRWLRLVPMEFVFIEAERAVTAADISFRTLRIILRHMVSLEYFTEHLLAFYYLRPLGMAAFFLSSLGASFSILLFCKRIFEIAFTFFDKLGQKSGRQNEEADHE